VACVDEPPVGDEQRTLEAALAGELPESAENALPGNDARSGPKIERNHLK
jgi:hypothetical protein